MSVNSRLDHVAGELEQQRAQAWYPIVREPEVRVSAPRRQAFERLSSRIERDEFSEEEAEALEEAMEKWDNTHPEWADWFDAFADAIEDMTAWPSDLPAPPGDPGDLLAELRQVTSDSDSARYQVAVWYERLLLFADKLRNLRHR